MSVDMLKLLRTEYKSFEEKTERVNEDLSLHEIEVTIERANDVLLPPDVKTLSYDLFIPLLSLKACRCTVHGEFGWPDLNTPQSFTTPEVSCSGPPFSPGLLFSFASYQPHTFRVQCETQV